MGSGNPRSGERVPGASRVYAVRGVALAVAMALAGFAGGAQAADSYAALRAQMRKLAERMEQLERRNRELEKEVVELKEGGTKAAQASAPARPPAQPASGAAATAAIEQRLKALEETQAQTDRSLSTERLSESEPELVTRLKALEYQTLSMQKQARQIEALEGISIGASLVGMVQRVDRKGAATGSAESRLNYRGDISVTLPGGSLGAAEGAIFTQLRFGQGNGVGLRPTFTSTPNTTTFEVAGVNDPDSSFAILAQAWYQLTVPLPLGGFKPYSRQRLVVNAGKIDPFVFFDQNAAADDETTRFVNNAFVHNPLLDSGRDVGVDAYGFTPGVRVAYLNEFDKARTWGASLGVFGSGPATNFTGSLGQPFVIGQLETSTRMINGLPGNYRLYAWRNGRAEDFDGSVAAHSGWGLSADQRVGDAFTLFARYGHRTGGRGTFDRALTVGSEIRGNAWSRAADAVGFAVGLLSTSSDYRNATADGTLIGYAASGSERVAELYYRYRFNDRVEITPDLQWIQRPGGDGSAPTATVIGLRARIGI